MEFWCTFSALIEGKNIQHNFFLLDVESSCNQPRPSDPAGTGFAAGARSKQQGQFLVFWGTVLRITYSA